MPWFKLHDLDPSVRVPEDAPPITRAMLQQHAGAFLGDLSALDAGYQGQTSGSTGQPVEVWMCAHALAHYTIHLEWLLERASLPLPEQPRVLHLTFQTGAEASREPLPVWDGGTLWREDVGSTAQLLELLSSSRPHILTTSPVGLERLLSATRSEDLQTPRMILTTMTALPWRLREEAQRHFGCPVVDSYGVAEIGPVAARCPVDPEGLWHVPAGSAWLEDTELGVAITTLRNRAMPLVRYLTGDHIEGLLDEHRCEACGHTGQSFRELSGRGATELLDKNGQPVSPLPLIRAMMALAPEGGVRRFQLVVEARGRAQLRLVLDQGKVPGAKLSEGARAALPGFDLDITSAPPRLTSRGKAPAILLLRDEAP
jgi:phenylacetate-CoA ligase